tara:strand:- start:7410 stop:7781 length:372 start_codon:yes stop_codon:yes gene_type:complete
MNKFPNKATQFSSTNQPEKRGRPKGVRNVATVLKELLSTHDQTLGGVGDFGSPIAKMLIKIAFSNDSNNNDKLKAIKEILDRIEGLPDQNVNVSANAPSWISEPEIEQEYDDLIDDETGETIL